MFKMCSFKVCSLCFFVFGLLQIEIHIHRLSAIHIDASFIFSLYFLYTDITCKNLMRFIFHYKCDSACVMLFFRNLLVLHMSVM
jgi:hypothetical protein